MWKCFTHDITAKRFFMVNFNYYSKLTSIWECAFYVTMSKCHNLITRIEKRTVQYFWNRTNAQNCVNFAQNARIIKKNMFFSIAFALQSMEIIWEKFNIKNALSIAANIILSINEVKFHSHTFICAKVYPDYFHAV